MDNQDATNEQKTLHQTTAGKKIVHLAEKIDDIVLI